MKKHTVRILAAIIATTLMVGISSTALAADYEDLTIAEGFVPDPAELTGDAGGTRAAADVHAGCVGEISTSPDHSVTLQGSFDYLSFRVFSSSDTSLVIRKPDGTYFCNDDSVGLDPKIDGDFPAGTYQVFVGSIDGSNPAYRLEVSELREDAAAADTEEPVSYFEDISLSTSFLPDPALAQGVAGGPRNASEVSSDCVGEIDTIPDHTVTLEVDFSYLRFRAFSDDDTSLVIRAPNGVYHCNDDGNGTGLDPQIEGAFTAGEYQVFIGAIGSGNPEYRLEVSEMRP